MLRCKALKFDISSILFQLGPHDRWAEILVGLRIVVEFVGLLRSWNAR